MKRTSLLTLPILIALHGTVYAHGMSTKAIQEFNKALTDDGFFGVPRYTTALLPVCTATSAKGKIGYDTTTNTIKFCNGSAWGAMGGGVALDGTNAWTGTNSYNALVSFTTNGQAANFANNSKLCFGPNADNCLTFNTAQTPDMLFMGLGATSRALVIGEDADAGFDYAHANPTNPTVYIHSAAQSPTQWTGIAHNGADGVISTGSGNLLLVATSATKQYSGATEVTSTFSSGLGILGGVFLGATSTGADARIEREAAAIIQLGADVNGAAVNQTFKAHDGITGTDVKGAALILEAGRGTGSAVSNPLTLNRVVTAATGTAAQTYSPSYISCPTKILSNTSATAQTIATITTTTTSAGNVTVDYATTACSASTCDADSGIVKVSWNNNAGTVAAAMSAVAVQSDSDATGTLATTPTATVATNVVSIKYTPTWVTIVPATVVGYATFKIHSTGDTVVCN